MEQPEETSGVAARSDQIEAFWVVAREHARLDVMPGYFGPSALGSVPPPSWAFGGTAEQADELLDLVLAGTKTATASAAWDYEVEGEPLPQVGDLGIVVDSAERPRALVATTAVEVRPFDQVDAEHARLEGEGDLSLAHWREAHVAFFSQFRSHDRPFSTDMPVVCERFEVIYSS